MIRRSPSHVFDLPLLSWRLLTWCILKSNVAFHCLALVLSTVNLEVWRDGAGFVLGAFFPPAFFSAGFLAWSGFSASAFFVLAAMATLASLLAPPLPSFDPPSWPGFLAAVFFVLAAMETSATPLISAVPWQLPLDCQKLFQKSCRKSLLHPRFQQVS